jgi:peptide deformylase
VKNYQLKIYPDTILREKAFPVLNLDGEIYDLIKAMSELMYTCKGIGLAAPQVGVLKRIIIADLGDGLLPLVNPIILDQEKQDHQEEGCLSLPEIQIDVMRAQNITVNGLNFDGKEVTMPLNGMLARVIQHEIDHLNGLLIIDHASSNEKILLHEKLKSMSK